MRHQGKAPFGGPGGGGGGVGALRWRQVRLDNSAGWDHRGRRNGSLRHALHSRDVGKAATVEERQVTIEKIRTKKQCLDQMKELKRGGLTRANSLESPPP